MQTNKTKNLKSRRVVAGVAIAAAAFTGVGTIPVVAPEYATQAQAAESGIWKYRVVDDHVELQGLTDEGKQKVQDNGGKLPDFPLEIEGKKVTSIGNFAFRDNKLTSLPKSWGNITTIGDSAFSSKQLTSIPDSWGNITTIGGAAFSSNQLTSLPDSWENITTINRAAFSSNQLTSIPDSWENITTIGNGAFQRNQLTSIPDSWGNITTIDSSAFSNNQLTSLPESWGNITTIGGGSFVSNKLTSIPDSWENITTIGNYAFNNNQLTSLPESWGNITTIGDYAFQNNKLTFIPESWGNITTIGNYAFNNNQLTSNPDWNTWKPMKDAKPNPRISKESRCTRQPLNVALVFDTSSSIKQTGIEGYKRAASDFVDTVSDKGISLASFDFSTDANAPEHLSKPEPLLVTKDSKEKVKTSINEHFERKGTTNWESGLLNVRDNNTVTNGKPRYDMVVFISDGFPNLKVTKEDIGYMQAAQKVANQLKEQGSKVISMGVGPDLDNDKISGLANLLPLSGLRENNDYYLGDWDELASMITHTTQNVTCGTQVDARAQIIDKNGKTTDSAAQGFEFSAEVTQTKHDNVTTVGESKKTTPNALWSFPFEFNDKTGDDLRQSTADITITQKPKDGFTFLNGEYKIVNNEDGKVITTGSLTGKSTVVKDVPADAHVQVVAKYHDSSITSDVKQSDNHNPGYDPAETTPGTAVDIEQVGDTELPDGTKFGTPDKTPDGWKITVNEKTGKVTATPPKDAKPGDKGEFTVPVTYPDGSKDNADVLVTVTVKDDAPGDKQSDNHNPGYDPAETTPGTAVDIEQVGDTELPDGTKFGTPDKTPEGWEVKVDEKTGKVTATPPEDAKPGDKGEFIVPVTYPDGSNDETPVNVTVKDEGDDTEDGGNTGGNTPDDSIGDSDKDNGSGDGDKGDGSSDGDKGDGSSDGDNTLGDGDNTGVNDGDNTPGGVDNTGGNTKRPDFSGLPEDDKNKDTSKSPTDDKDKDTPTSLTDDSNDKDKPSGSKVVDNGNKGGTDDNTNASDNGVKGGFKPVTPVNPSRVNEAPSAPSGFTPITGPGVGAVLAGESVAGSGTSKGAVVDTGGSVHQSFWTKIANLFR